MRIESVKTLNVIVSSIDFYLVNFVNLRIMF